MWDLNSHIKAFEDEYQATASWHIVFLNNFHIFQAGRTPLHYAAADPNGEHMIKVLQKAGGDAFIDDKVSFCLLLHDVPSENSSVV